MSGSETVTAGCPPEVLEWIPWYPDEGLSEAQRGAVEAHAAECDRCREEIALVRGEAGAGAEHADAPDLDALYARVLARMGEESAAGGAPLPAPEADARESGAGRRPAAARPRRRLRRELAAAAAAGLLLGAGLVAGGAALWAPGAGPIYTTASQPPAPASGPALDVVLRDDASVLSVTDALRGLGGQIVSGPSALGVLRVELPAGADAGAAARLLRAGPARLAEPVRGVP